jgi:phosphoadenosine phosphosulfate reductase
MSTLSLHTAETFESTHPVEILRWADETYGDTGLVYTCSFSDPVLIHLVAKAAPRARVVLLDTRYHFAETWWYARKLEREFGFTLEVAEPDPAVVPDDQWQTDIEGCCGRRKVEPLNRTLAGNAAWITGVRRADATTRTATPIVTHDLLRNIVKINPLANWTDADMALYIQMEELPEHPLTAKGYPSIGCWPCTNPVAPGDDPRSGRWAGAAKTECGLHK